MMVTVFNVMALMGAASASIAAEINLGDCKLSNTQGNNAISSTCHVIDASGVTVTDLQAEVNELRMLVQELRNKLVPPPPMTPPSQPPMLPPQSPPPPLPPPKSLTCEQDGDWQYLFEIEDDDSLQDMPWDQPSIATGFSNPNAYYYGNTFLESLALDTVELCFGHKANDRCEMNCRPLNDGKIGPYITLGGGPSDLSTDFKRMVGCFTGQCASNAYGEGFFWYCSSADTMLCGSRIWQFTSTYDAGSWSIMHQPEGYSNGVGGHNTLVHFWGSGFSLNNCNNEVGYGCWGDPGFGAVTPSIYQIRYKLA